MKDAYSFDRDEPSMAASYQAMVEAYRRIFDRCGLEYRVVEADPGQIGGDVNHEFLAMADVGEDRFVYCENCDYSADLEAAVARPPEASPPSRLEPLEEVATPGRSTIKAVSELLSRPSTEMLKCMLYDAGGTTVAVLIPGDREVNEEKVARAMWPQPVRLFDDEDFARGGFVKGFVGPQGMPEEVEVIADLSVRAGGNWITGANKRDFHATGANEGRDFRVDRWEDVSQVRPGEPCPVCGGRLQVGRGIVVGHTYQLGARYSKPLEATFIDEDGERRPFMMGCYGIGLTRIIAAAAEQNHDDAGLTWPKALAPYEFVVLPTNMDHPEVVQAAERIYSELAAGGSALIDDREASAGVKFADADLIGFPVQVVVGKRGIESGLADLKIRATGERSQVAIERAGRGAAEALDRAP
jgi:prolyl-tRNA synthetase